MPERRTAAKLIRFHPDELARITACAHACRQTPARYIRETALNAKPKASRRADADPTTYELARIGQQLEQLVRTAGITPRTILANRLHAALDLHGAVLERFVRARHELQRKAP